MEYFLLAGAVAVFVENRLQTGFTYAELEQATGFSLAHIRAVYAKLTGKTLSRYILGRRIANAAFDIIHTRETLLAIAVKYGFSNPDSFTRAFRRVTGVTPSEFRKQRRPVGRAVLCAGVYGVALQPERSIVMNNHEQRRAADSGVVLYGVPKVYYGAFDGITPLPICIKAAANYMGMEVEYEEANVYCGTAFRLTWNETGWDGGNVGDLFTFDTPEKVFRCAIESLGCEYTLIGRSSETEKSEFSDFIKAKIDEGIPVIARGIIGPPEAGIITGYRDGGDTLLGWNFFQAYPEVAAGVRFDASGYYITDQWWENKNTNAVMALGKATGEKYTLKTIVENAIEVMTPRRKGTYAKAGYAYNAWKKAILDDGQFGKSMIAPLLVERMMCHADAVDCLADGRGSAGRYFKRLAREYGAQPLLGQIAEQFTIAGACAHKMYGVLGGFERGEKQMQALLRREVREELGRLIDECKLADEKALGLLQELLAAL